MLPGLSDPFWAGLFAKMLAIAGIVVAVSAQRLTSPPNQGATPMRSWRCPGSRTIAKAIDQSGDLGCQTAA